MVSVTDLLVGGVVALLAVCVAVHAAAVLGAAKDRHRLL